MGGFVIIAIVCGRLTKDAETHVAGDTTVTGFSVATNTKVKGEEVACFVEASLWGKRGQALSQYLVKGKQVMVTGELTTRTYKEKTYLEMRVDQIELLGGGKREEDSSAPKGGRRPEHRTTKAEKYNPNGEDIPF